MSNLQKLIANARSGLSVQEKSLMTVGRQSLGNVVPLIPTSASPYLEYV